MDKPVTIEGILRKYFDDNGDTKCFICFMKYFEATTAIKELVRARVEGMKFDIKLCGKGYNSCSVCPYADDECDHKKHYNQALTDILKLVEGL